MSMRESKTKVVRGLRPKLAEDFTLTLQRLKPRELTELRLAK